MAGGAAGALAAFAEEVGAEDPVAPVGGRTQWNVGGEVDPGCREVRPPRGVVEYEPAEMVVRCLASTTCDELAAALAGGGQMVPLDPRQPEKATVGGVLSVGQSGLRRLRYGPVRDTLLEVRYVAASGRLVKAGGPVVKNVSGFDLGRLLVGALGTLGVLAEVVLRAQPRPPVAVWLMGRADPFTVRDRVFRPSSVLWDGDAVWVLLEGRRAEVDAERAALGPGFAESEPPALPTGGRLSLRPSELRGLRDRTDPFVAEIGVGTVHVPEAVAAKPVDPSTAALHARVKAAFDPTGRLNPGRHPASVAPSEGHRR